MGGIIWLASYPKSGNTWTRTFIHNLLLNPEGPIAVNSIDAFVLGDMGKAGFAKIAGKPFEELSRLEIARLRPQLHESFTRAHPDSVFVKTHSCLGSAFNIPLITMEYTAGAIYVVRNPLDVVISLADHFGVGLDEAMEILNDPRAVTKETEALWEFALGSWSGHVRSWMQFDRKYCFWMRYEDMLEKPVPTFGGLVKFLGLNPPEERLLKAIDFSSFDVVQKLEEQTGFKEKPDTNERFFRVGKSGQWKEVLSDAQIDRIVKTHHDTMKLFDYLPK